MNVNLPPPLFSRALFVTSHDPAGISSYSNYETIKSFTKYRYCFLCSGILNFNFLLA